MVARGGEDDYADRHLEAADVLLVVEVADSALRHDRAEKMRRYARSGIPEAWLVDVADRSVTAYTAPGAGGYAGEHVYGSGAEVAASAVAGLCITVDEIVGRVRDDRVDPR